MRGELVLSAVTEQVIGAFYEVYNHLRHGYLESVYVNALVHELRLRGLPAAREVPIAVFYKGQAVGAFRADVLVDDQVIVETKAARALDPTAEAQVLNYLRGTGMPVAVLLHFGPQPAFRRLVATQARGSARLRQPDDDRSA